MPILELQSVSKHFGAIHALNEVDMTLEAGEVLGLMGDNGAGKSTLVKVIAGNFPPTHGEIRIAGEPVHFHKPVEARQKGVEVVYQDLALCNNLSAAANVFLGREIKRRAGPFRWLDHKAMAQARRRTVQRAQVGDEARATSCGRCRAASGRRSRSPARACRRRAWC